MQRVGTLWTRCTSFGSRFLVKMFLMKVSCTSSCLTRNCHRRFTGSAEGWQVLKPKKQFLHFNANADEISCISSLKFNKMCWKILFLIWAVGADLKTPHIWCLRQNTSSTHILNQEQLICCSMYCTSHVEIYRVTSAEGEKFLEEQFFWSYYWCWRQTLINRTASY